MHSKLLMLMEVMYETSIDFFLNIKIKSDEPYATSKERSHKQS